MKARRDWVSAVISRLIRSGLGDDERGFDETYLPLAERVIVRIIEKQPAAAGGRSGDALNEAINTAKGAAVETLIQYARRRAHLPSEKGEDQVASWGAVQGIFDRELERCREGNYEFSALAGAYLPTLGYLSLDWVTANINRMFPKEYETNWRCAIEGYAYVTHVYDDLYRLLREHGHFKKALQTDFGNRQIREKIIQQISVGYLRGWESLDSDDSLFAEMLRRFDPGDVSYIVWFFWTLRKQGLSQGMLDAIMQFWKWCSERIRGHETENARLLSDLTLFAAFLTDISPEAKTFLLQAAPYVDEKHHSSLLLEYLDMLTDHSPGEVGEVYLAMLAKTLPTHDESNIRSIIEKMYQRGLKELANQICDRYAQKGSEILRDLYDRYNS
ncbi:MAG: hypothetical protein ACE5JQ_15685 [Candidatus Methylomirabilales bacterium]